ncbi:MAG TPA: hypothetical protein VLV78_21070 [Thermoanaerobaculia bacterium]|nr:hypothetical protein [Thermoanaerobaculia bacterium]
MGPRPEARGPRFPFITALLFLVASAAAAQTRPIFPADYKPSPCAPQNVCESFTEVDFPSAALHFLLRELDSSWNEQHREELTSAVQPFCTKRATCMATPGNMWWFCNDVFAQELRADCDAKFKNARDNEQCHTWMDTYAAGVDQRGKADWEAAQACAKEKIPPPASPKKFVWWSVPVTIPVNYAGPVQVFTIDADTRVPVQADIAFEGQTLYASDPPTGKPTSYYLFTWPRKLVRVPNAEGHSDLVPVTMTISAAGYEPVRASVPTIVPKMIVSVKRDGKTTTVTATDSVTGKPVEAQVYLGDRTIGFTNQPIELPAKSKSQIWVRSPYDKYSDVVVKN